MKPGVVVDCMVCVALAIAGRAESPGQEKVICIYNLSPSEMHVPSGGGTRTLTVLVNGGCVWSASSEAPWVLILGDTGGDGTKVLILSVLTNEGMPRSGSVRVSGGLVGGSLCTIVQEGPATDIPGTGSGWRSLGWLGGFYDAGNGWFFHVQHGWLYCRGDSMENLWFYSLDMGWLWSSVLVYPWFYRQDAECWLFYVRDTTQPRWFFNWCSQQWEAH